MGRARWTLLGLALAGCARADDPSGAPLPEHPTFSSDVAGIVYRSCTPCHQPGGPGPFPIETYEDVRERAALIARAVADRRMPPWLPEPSDYPFANERRLSDREIGILQRWVEQGAPAGDTQAAPAPPVPADGWVLGRPDLVLEMAEPYVVPGAEHVEHDAAAHHDVFRNFVIPVPLDETRWVRALEFRSDDGRVVHHAVMGIDATPSSRERDARDPGPGYDGMLERSAARPPDGFFTVWIPGAVPRWNPDGLAWPLEPGTDFVIQAHLRRTSEPVPVRLMVGVHFGEPPARQPPVVLYLLGRTIDIPAGAPDYAVRDSFTLPVDMEVLGLYPHAHYLGRSMDLHAVLPDGTERTLLRIPRWDFAWQDTYPFANPVALPAGTELRMLFRYDNSRDNPRNPFDPPRRVTLGGNSTDEMGELWVQARPRDPAQRPAVEDALARKVAQDLQELQEHLVRVRPEDPSAHAGLASVYDARGDIERALEDYRRAVALDADFAQAHYNLALLLERRGAAAEAMRHYQEAIRAFPGYADAHNNLGSLLARAGRTADAETHYRRALEIDPGHPGAHVNLGGAAQKAGRVDEAVRHYRGALSAVARSGEPPFDPAELRFNLGLLLILAGEPDEALEHLAEAARLAPRSFSPRITAGWMLATHPDAAVRRPEQALRLGEEIRRAMGGDHPAVLDLLAAAHAAAGNFDPAVALAREAVRLAEAGGDRAFAAEVGQRLALYLEHRPFIARRP